MGTPQPIGLAMNLQRAALATNKKLRKTMLLASPVARGMLETKRREICERTMQRAGEILDELTTAKIEKCSALELAKVYGILTASFKPLAEDLTGAEKELAGMSDAQLEVELQKVDDTTPN
jgi:hypothetical protein